MLAIQAAASKASATLQPAGRQWEKQKENSIWNVSPKVLSSSRMEFGQWGLRGASDVFSVGARPNDNCSVSPLSLHRNCDLERDHTELPSPPEIHHIAFHAFLIASLLASLASLAAICISRRKPKKKPPLGEKIESLGPTSKADFMVAAAIENEKQETEKQEEDITELEEIHGPMTEMPKSKRRLSMSSSMGLQAKLSRLKTGRKEKRNEDDETLWKKTIIMGERNKVPPWEEEEEEAVGRHMGENCRRNYRPRSLPVSPIKRIAEENTVRPMTAF